MSLAASRPSSELETIRLQQQPCAAFACFEIFWARGKKATPPYQANKRAESSRTLFQLAIHKYTSYAYRKRMHDGLREDQVHKIDERLWSLRALQFLDLPGGRCAWSLRFHIDEYAVIKQCCRSRKPQSTRLQEKRCLGTTAQVLVRKAC
jgi:hypothetical protein